MNKLYLGSLVVIATLIFSACTTGKTSSAATMRESTEVPITQGTLEPTSESMQGESVTPEPTLTPDTVVSEESLESDLGNMTLESETFE